MLLEATRCGRFREAYNCRGAPVAADPKHTPARRSHNGRRALLGVLSALEHTIQGRRHDQKAAPDLDHRELAASRGFVCLVPPNS